MAVATSPAKLVALVGPGTKADQASLLELGVPQVLGQPVVDLAREARALLESGGGELRVMEPSQLGVSLAQLVDIGSALCPKADEQDGVEGDAQDVPAGHQRGVRARVDGEVELAEGRDHQPDRQVAGRHPARPSRDAQVEEGGGEIEPTDCRVEEEQRQARTRKLGMERAALAHEGERPLTQERRQAIGEDEPDHGHQQHQRDRGEHHRPCGQAAQPGGRRGEGTGGQQPGGEQAADPLHVDGELAGSRERDAGLDVEVEQHREQPEAICQAQDREGARRVEGRESDPPHGIAPRRARRRRAPPGSRPC